MKKKTTQNLIATLLLAFCSVTGFAQTQERTYTLNPKTLTPSPAGYYVAGTTTDVGGVPTFFNGCEDRYGDSHHIETGSQQGFSYGGAMIMPTCAGKGTPPADWADNIGYIQLTKHKQPGTETATFGSLTTQQITNLKRVEVKAGSDVSINAGRRPFFAIETSLDNGATWDVGPFLTQELTQQGGETFVYEANGSNPGFNQMVARSNTQPIRLRIVSWFSPGATEGQRIKIFGASVTATGAPVTSLKSELASNEPFFSVTENAFVATSKGSLSVYNLTGALIGSGETVTIPGKGLFIVRSEKGQFKKVFLQ